MGPRPGRVGALPGRGHQVAPARRGSAVAASGRPSRAGLGRRLRGNNAAPPRVARRGIERPTPERGQPGERAGGRQGGRARREPWARRGAGPGSGAARRRGRWGRGPGAASSPHRGRGPGDEGARGGEPVCAPRRRPARRASPSRQTRGRRSGGAPPPGPQNVKRGSRDAGPPGRAPSQPSGSSAAPLPLLAEAVPTPRAAAPAAPPRSHSATARSGSPPGPVGAGPRTVRPASPATHRRTSLNNDHSQPRWEDNGQKMPGHPETLSVKFSPGWHGEVFFPRGGGKVDPATGASQWQRGLSCFNPW